MITFKSNKGSEKITFKGQHNIYYNIRIKKSTMIKIILNRNIKQELFPNTKDQYPKN